MDRQAWIAVTLCVLGLIGWQFYMTSHAPPRVATAPPRAAVSPSPSDAPQPAPAANVDPTPAVPAAAAAATPAAPGAAVTPFEEKTETLRNGDIELRLTNRGGGISEAHLLNHAAEKGQGTVVLNAPDRLPIGAVLEQPNEPTLREFTMARQPDGSV
ncbi:MAG: hypothetical protein M3Y80_09720, partial [Verrucomicrobiota bacterium]|nr:hypothetical protein [Verrucomicrobiota bacterium]